MRWARLSHLSIQHVEHQTRARCTGTHSSDGSAIDVRSCRGPCAYLRGGLRDPHSRLAAVRRLFMQSFRGQEEGVARSSPEQGNGIRLGRVATLRGRQGRRGNSTRTSLKGHGRSSLAMCPDPKVKTYPLPNGVDIDMIAHQPSFITHGTCKLSAICRTGG